MMDVCLKLAVVLVLLTAPSLVVGHATPCNQGNDTMCLEEGVRVEFLRSDYWFGDGYMTRCPNGTATQEFYCMNPDTTYKTIASRMLRHNNFTSNTIEQFLHIRYNAPRGHYIACGHMYELEPYSATKDMDNTHSIYTDMWILSHKPSISFTPEPGALYTLVAYDAGYLRLGGIWVNIMTSDTSTGMEVYPYMGPVNPMWTLRNPYVFALFKQKDGREILNIEEQKRDIMQSIMAHNGHYHLDQFINNNMLEGPVGVGFVVIKADPYGIQHFVDRNVFNNCPYLVSRNKDLLMALEVMGFEMTSHNSYSDYRGAFLTKLEMDMRLTFIDHGAHFSSCCKHVMYSEMRVEVDPLDSKPIMPVHMRSKPIISLSPMEMVIKTFPNGKIYSLFLVDATDAAHNVTDGNVLIHWQVVNIPGTFIERGDVVHEYIPPMPMTMNETRIFIMLLVRQSAVIVDPDAMWPYTAPDCSEEVRNRCKFNLGSYIKHLNGHLAGISIFYTEQDDFVRGVMTGEVNPDHMEGVMRGAYSILTDHHRNRTEVCHSLPQFDDPCPDDCGYHDHDDDDHDDDHDHDHDDHDHDHK